MLAIEQAFAYTGIGILVAVGIYLVVRLASAAFYKSKKDYEKTKTIGKE